MTLSQVMCENRLNIFQCALCTMKVSCNILDDINDKIICLINQLVYTIKILQYFQFVITGLCKQQNERIKHF